MSASTFDPAEIESPDGQQNAVGAEGADQGASNELRRYRELFDHAPAIYLTTDVNGVVREANAAAVSFFRVPQDRLPAWVSEVEREMIVADVDWNRLARDGAAWMGYWDRHVRGTGREAAR